ncbi:hypothetical protein NUU61_000790 [Penicillium alfredii]|uniref:BTB domain transcription factor n=1 Tax=Penicillium alfredii TaxID=1506179 RepID=A0A9W9GA93_9EURO|nr:uncharacterized protein NUU61_000790 [Penicillium alfredii]KAJ5115031.1 hypothetical protein NUU61_000790 [Penicillium alfredii]
MPRTSSRQAAQKAKEAISSTESTERAPTGSKRKAPPKPAPQPKKEKTEKQLRPENESEANEEQAMGAMIDGTPELKAKGEKEPKPEQPPRPALNIESGVRKSDERETVVSSNIREKGVIYFFFRPRVNVEDPHSVEDVARSFFVLRPTPLGAELNEGQGPVDKDARCRLMILPKKKFPTSGRERDMGFVEKSGQSMKDLQEKFLAGATYQTSTRGERSLQEAKPYAEGVYAITSTKRAAHLAYILTIPTELGDIQKNFGLRERGSWILQSKNPKYPGPGYAQLPKDPEYPESVREKFGDLRWVPLEPEFLEYPNAQFLMIGEAQNELGKAATAEGAKEPNEQEPGEELERMEQENEQRVEALRGDETVYQDLGLDAQKYPKVPSTWNSES